MLKILLLDFLPYEFDFNSLLKKCIKSDYDVINYGIFNNEAEKIPFEEMNIIFFNCFCNENNYKKIIKTKAIKIFMINEPAGTFYYKFAYQILTENKFDMVFGSINNYNKICFKYPLYLFYIPNYGIFNITNDYVKFCNIKNKNFATLINTHDHANTRNGIYQLLKLLKKIDCPSKLFNNMTSDILSDRRNLGQGNIKFLQNYMFNICPENSKCNFEGYITEKLMFCSLGGAIPIYFGSFDEIDGKIFNKNRIIFFNPYDYESVYSAYSLVKELINDENKLENFYRQNVFMDTAEDTVKMLNENLINWFEF